MHPNPPPYPEYFGDDAAAFQESGQMLVTSLPGLAEAPEEATPEGTFEKHWLKTLAHVLTEEVQELFSSEKLLTETLPLMCEAATGKILRLVCEDQVQQARQHIIRIEQVQKALGLLPDGRTCQLMEGLIVGLCETIEENRPSVERDDNLLLIAHKIKHFEVTAYCGARDFAQLLGLEPVAELLQKNLDEKSATEVRLANLMELIRMRGNIREWR